MYSFSPSSTSLLSYLRLLLFCRLIGRLSLDTDEIDRAGSLFKMTSFWGLSDISSISSERCGCSDNTITLSPDWHELVPPLGTVITSTTGLETLAIDAANEFLLGTYVTVLLPFCLNFAAR